MRDSKEEVTPMTDTSSRLVENSVEQVYVLLIELHISFNTAVTAVQRANSNHRFKFFVQTLNSSKIVFLLAHASIIYSVQYA